MATGAITGKNGKVNINSVDVEVTNWSLNDISNNPSYASNETGGVKARVIGVGDSNGTFQMIIPDSATIPVAKGTALTTLKLYYSATHYYAIAAAVVDSVAIACDINDGNPIFATVSWSANGAAPTAT